MAASGFLHKPTALLQGNGAVAHLRNGVHFVDVFRYLGGKITKVYARPRTLNGNIEGEDFAWAHVGLANGMLGLFDADRLNENTADNPRLSFGNVLIEGNKGSLRLYDDGRIAVRPLGGSETLHSYEFQKINLFGDCVFSTLKHLIESLISKDSLETDVAVYKRHLVVQDKIYGSNEKVSPLDAN